VNFRVCNESPETSDDIHLIGPIGTYEELFREIEELLDKRHAQVTSGPLCPEWAVNLLTELNRDEYMAVLGPPPQSKANSNRLCLQAYFYRK
jgi:hypothetical protein